MSSEHPFLYEELASIRVSGFHSTHPITQQNMVNNADYETLVFMSSQHPFHYQELASIRVRGLHSTHPIQQSQHPLGLGDFTTSIPLLNKIGNQSRLLNSYLVYELTASIPLPRDSIHQCQGNSQHPFRYSTKLVTKVDFQMLHELLALKFYMSFLPLNVT